jgi:divalent metal cation (Fe/Co/Zn/Cd) transporter
MDVSDEDVAEALRAAAIRGPTVQKVSDVRVRWLGRELEVRMVIQLPANTTLAQSHDVAHRVQETVRAEVSDCGRSWWSLRRMLPLHGAPHRLDARADS